MKHLLERSQPLVAIMGLVFTAMACLATYLALPPVQRFLQRAPQATVTIPPTQVILVEVSPSVALPVPEVPPTAVSAQPAPAASPTAVSAQPVPTASPTAVPVQPTPTISPTAVPAYHLYDDLASAGALKKNWTTDDERGICSLGIERGRLIFDCSNKEKEAANAGLYAAQQAEGLDGVSVVLTLNRADKPVQLITTWSCPADGSERAYHLALDGDAAEAFYSSLPAWDSTSLGGIRAAMGRPYQLRIERNGDQIEFFVDDALLVSAAPETSCQLTGWGFGFFSLVDGDRLQGSIELVKVRP